MVGRESKTTSNDAGASPSKQARETDAEQSLVAQGRKTGSGKGKVSLPAAAAALNVTEFVADTSKPLAAEAVSLQQLKAQSPADTLATLSSAAASNHVPRRSNLALGGTADSRSASNSSISTSHTRDSVRNFLDGECMALEGLDATSRLHAFENRDRTMDASISSAAKRSQESSDSDAEKRPRVDGKPGGQSGRGNHDPG